MHIGDLRMVSTVRRGQVHQCCAMIRELSRISVTFESPDANMDLVPIIMLLPMMQDGFVQNSCACCTYPLQPPASGSMFDCGRNVTFERAMFDQVLNVTTPVGSGPGIAYGGTSGSGSGHYS